MIEKIKNIVFYTMITYSIFIIFLTIINVISLKKDIELKDNEENLTKINILKEEISKVEEGTCKNLLNEMIELYEKTSFNGKVKKSQIYDIYYNGTSFLSFYERIVSECNISKEKMKSLNMPYYTMLSTVYMDNMISKKIFEYELKIKDIQVRGIAEGNRANLDYNLSKQSEIMVIENVLVNRGGISNEEIE